MDLVLMEDMKQRQLQEVLQHALTEGWQNFQQSSERSALEKAFCWMVNDANFYNSGFRGLIPHPVYDNAAKRICQKFITKSRIKGVCFDPLFPGDYDRSVESEQGEYEIRTFFLEPYKNNLYIGPWYLSFSHSHERLYFPRPPTIEITEIY